MRTLPNVNMNDEKVLASAKNADAPNTGVSGKYEVEIVQASLSEASTGSVFITLAFKMPNGKVYKQDPKQIVKPDGSDGYYLPKLRTLFGITKASDKQGTMAIKEFDFIDGEAVEKEVKVPAYVGLLGKKVGVVLYFYQAYPESLGINGYTGSPIPTKGENEAGYQEAKSQATTIWMPNYNKDAQPNFEFVQFFDVASGKNFAELVDDNCTEPKSVSETLEKVLARNHKAIQLKGADWDKLRIKKLKANLKKIGQQFDTNQFIPSEGSSVSDTDDVDLV